MPTTTRGNVHQRKRATSTTRYSVARIRQHQPVENSAHDGVQIRFTDGQMPDWSSAYPSASPAAPPTDRNSNLRRLERDERSTSPHIRPKIMVASDGTKFSVW